MNFHFYFFLLSSTFYFKLRCRWLSTAFALMDWWFFTQPILSSTTVSAVKFNTLLSLNIGWFNRRLFYRLCWRFSSIIDFLLIEDLNHCLVVIERWFWLNILRVKIRMLKYFPILRIVHGRSVASCSKWFFSDVFVLSFMLNWSFYQSLLHFILIIKRWQLIDSMQYSSSELVFFLFFVLDLKNFL